MRKLEPRDNQWAEQGRLDKAAALAECLRENYGPITQDVLDALPTQSYEWWGSLAKAAKVNPPSPAAVEATIGILATEKAFRVIDNPLAGLPRLGG